MDKGLIATIYKELLYFNKKKTHSNPTEKWAKDLNKGFKKVADKHIRISASLVIGEMQIKTTEISIHSPELLKLKSYNINLSKNVDVYDCHMLLKSV